MSSRESRKFTRIVDRVDNLPGADLNRDFLKVAIGSLDISSLDENLTSVGGTQQSSVDIASKIDSIESILDTGQLNVQQQGQVKIEADDDSGNTAELQAEELGTALGGTETGLVTYLAQALAAIGNDQVRVDIESNNAGTLPTEQQSPVQLEDSTGTNINPDEAPDYPDNRVTGADLTTGDETIGPFTVARSESMVIAVNEVSGGSLDVKIEWLDGSGNIFQVQDASELQLSGVTQDWANVVRKGPQARITLSDNTSATNTNAYMDTSR